MPYKRMLSPTDVTFVPIEGTLLGDAFARRVPVSAFCRYRVSLQPKKRCHESSASTINRFPCGSVPEIIVEGETGFIVEDIDRAVEAVGKIEQISRARCRREFEERFTDRHMAHDYLRIYQQLLSRSSTQAAA
jgi:hypothetical protein